MTTTTAPASTTRTATALLLLVLWCGTIASSWGFLQLPLISPPPGVVRQSTRASRGLGVSRTPTSSRTTSAGTAKKAAATAKPKAAKKKKDEAPPRVEVKFVTSNPLKTKEVKALLAEGGLQVPFDISTLVGLSPTHPPTYTPPLLPPTYLYIEPPRLLLLFLLTYSPTHLPIQRTSICLSFRTIQSSSRSRRPGLLRSSRRARCWWRCA